MKLTGRAWKFGDNIDTDQIIPARYLSISNPIELSRHCLEVARQDFARIVEDGDFIIGGNNFGCGSSREEAPFVIKEIGIKAVIAKSFARIFSRNAINIGLPVIECEKVVDETSEGDGLEIDLYNGELRNLASNKIYNSTPVPEFLQQIIDAGGLLNFAQQELKKTKEV